MHLAFNRLIFFTHQASDFNNLEKMRNFIMFSSYSMGGFLSNQISSRYEILLVSSRDETHV